MKKKLLFNCTNRNEYQSKHIQVQIKSNIVNHYFKTLNH